MVHIHTTHAEKCVSGAAFFEATAEREASATVCSENRLLSGAEFKGVGKVVCELTGSQRKAQGVASVRQATYVQEGLSSLTVVATGRFEKEGCARRKH